MVSMLKLNELYRLNLSIRTWMITVKTDDVGTLKFIMQGGETKARSYAKELGRDFHGEARFKEIMLK